MEQSKRLARPQGSTFLSLRFQQSNSEEDREAIYKHVINIYTLHGFMWNNRPATINQLSQIIRIPIQKVLHFISELGNNMGSLASPQNIENTLKSIITLSTTWAIQDRGLITNQLNQLLASQDGKYKPFISSEVNKILKLMIESNKGLQDAYKTFFTSTNNVTNILNVVNKDKKESEQEYLSPDEALLMLQELQKDKPSQPKPLNDIINVSQTVYSNDADELFGTYGLANLKPIRENRTGSAALEPSENPETPQSQETIRSSENHEDHHKRRGEAVVDLDTLPNES